MRKNHMAPLLLLASFFLTLFTACGKEVGIDPTETTGSGITTLWVVTEETAAHHMNGQTENVIKEFEKEHEDVEIFLDILPIKGEERAVRLQQLRTEIMAGGGPDAYLLPTDYQYFRTDYDPEAELPEPLFLDVEQSMHNGLFTDISAYYDADDTLGKEGLLTTVMDAGTIGEKRFVLPLRYDMPVLYVDTEALEASGLDIGAIESGILGLFDTVLEKGDPQFAADARPIVYYQSMFDLLPELFDYEAGKVKLTADQLMEYLTRLQAVDDLAGSTLPTNACSTNSYINDSERSLSFDRPMQNRHLSLSTAVAAIAQAEKREVTMIPLRATDGDLVAEVTYYAAVGAGCEKPDLAYAFLREFLTEESQWEENRPRSRAKRDSGIYVSSGWPVRSRGAVTYLWNIERESYLGYSFSTGDRISRRRKIITVKLTDSDVPVLEEEIDRVRFRLSNLELDVLKELMWVFWGLDSGPPTDEDIVAAAEKVIQELQWHIDEG